MRVLLTGFNPFGENRVNPSQRVVEALAARPQIGFELITQVLPTEFAAAGSHMRSLIREKRPDAVVMLGLAAGRSMISFERVALNLNDSSAPDNAGDQPVGRLIAPQGPAAYWSTFPLERMQSALQERQIPVGVSNHAGTYVCNHVFYTARHELEQLGSSALCGFIHLPSMPSESESGAGMPLAQMVDAVELVLTVLQHVRAAPHV